MAEKFKKMKKFVIFLLFFILIIGFKSVLATSTPPDPPQDGHGQNNDLPPGGGAPIGDGSIYLGLLAGVYLIYRWRKKLKINKKALLIPLIVFSITSFAGTIPPNPPSSGHGAGGDQPPSGGGGAPIGDGVTILMLLGGTYALYKNKKDVKYPD